MFCPQIKAAKKCGACGMCGVCLICGIAGEIAIAIGAIETVNLAVLF